MPLHGTHEKLDTSYYFHRGNVNKRKNIIIPENILELEKLIKEKKNTIKFLELLYDEEYFDSTIDQFNEHILEKIDSYKNASDEKLLFEESNYYVIYLGRYYIETKEGNHRNWIYSIELDTEYEQLQNTL